LRTLRSTNPRGSVLRISGASAGKRAIWKPMGTDLGSNG
jgi:hypothetical protein